MCIDIANTPKVHGLSLDKKTGKWPKKSVFTDIRQEWNAPSVGEFELNPCFCQPHADIFIILVGKKQFHLGNNSELIQGCKCVPLMQPGPTENKTTTQ